MITFQKEKLSDVFDEAMPLFKKHWIEVDYFKDEEFNPDKEKYLAIEKYGTYNFYTARKNDTLVGYTGFIKSHSLHNPKSYRAIQDVIFIDPEHRGFGTSFIAWTEKELRKENIDVIYQCSRAVKSFGSILEKQGYTLIDLVYGKRVL